MRIRVEIEDTGLFILNRGLRFWFWVSHLFWVPVTHHLSLGLRREVYDPHLKEESVAWWKTGHKTVLSTEDSRGHTYWTPHDYRFIVENVCQEDGEKEKKEEK